MTVDFGRIAADYAAYRRPFPPRLFDRLRYWGIALPGQSVLDIGAGTGLMARELARRGCRVIAADPSLPLLRLSEQAADNEPPGNLGNLRHIAAAAPDLPFPNDEFDGCCAAQCWHWLDRRRTPAQILRILRPGGWLAVVYQMYIPLPGTPAEASERLILQFKPHWVHANSAGINGQVLRDMQSAGFTQIESFTFDLEHQYNHADWRGLIRTTSAVGASLSPAALEQFDQQHTLLLESFTPMLTIAHRLFAAIAFKAHQRL